jgi:outer membrane protein assembly factor BamB
MVRTVFGMLVTGMVAVLAVAASAQENWPQWRGPDQNDIAATADPPVTWSETENIVWKTALPSWSGGSPIVWGDKVYLMSPSKPGDSKEEQSTGGPKLLLLCIAKADGKVLWEHELAEGNKLGNKQNSTSPTPVTDGAHLWAITGSGILTAMDMDGKELWKKDVQALYGKFGMQFGYASSPVLYGGSVILSVQHGWSTDDPSYMVAFDSLTGEVRWRVERPTTAVLEGPDAYNTPTLLQVNGKTQIILSGGDCVTGHDADTGREIWRAWGLNPKHGQYNRIIPTVAVGGGMVFAASRVKPLIAVRADGEGDVTETHTAWKWDKVGAPDVPTPICDGKHLYMVDDGTRVTCVDIKTGQPLWGPERAGEGIVSASPLLAAGRIYFTNEEAVTFVVSAGPEFKLLATNKLDEAKTLSSFAVSNNQLFLRTATHLYCIGKK